MAKSLINSIISKLTDDEGLFQGGEQGRAFGRIQDLFGREGVHDTINKEISKSGSRVQSPNRQVPDYMEEADMNQLRQEFTEPSRFVELLTAMSPDIAANWQEHGGPPLEDYSEGPGTARASGKRLPFRASVAAGEQAYQLDDILRAILGQQYGEHTEEQPYTAKDRSRPWQHHMSDQLMNDYLDGDMNRIMKIDPNRNDWALIPRDITDIVDIIRRGANY